MKVSKRNYKFLLRLFPHLLESEVLSKDDICQILSFVEPISFWKRLAKWMLWIAVISLGMSIILLFADIRFLQFLRRLFRLPILAKVIGASILSGVFYRIGVVRRRQKPLNIYTNKALIYLGIAATAGSVFWFGELSGIQDARLICMAGILYGILGVSLESSDIWLYSLLSLGWCFGVAKSFFPSLFFAGSVQLRFLCFGMILLVGTMYVRKQRAFQSCYNISRNMALLVLFASLWALSIFGTCESLTQWYQVKQGAFIYWSLLLGLASGMVFYVGCRWNDAIYRGFGMIFLILNVYTRFFEFCWEPLHASVFFFLCGITLWYLGVRAERIWVATERLLISK